MLINLFLPKCKYPHAHFCHHSPSNFYEFKVLWLHFSIATPRFLLHVSKSLQKSHLLCFLQQQSPDAPPTPSCRTSAFLILVVLADILPVVHHIPSGNASLSTHIQFVSHASDSTLRIYLDLNAFCPSAAAATLTVVIITPAWITAVSPGTPPTSALDSP